MEIESKKQLEDKTPKWKEQWEMKVKALIYFVLICGFMELALQLVVYHSFGKDILYALLFSSILGSVLFFFSSLFPEIINHIISVSLITVLIIYYEVQFVYYCIFKSFMPISQMLMGADAVTNFTAQMFYAMGENIFQIVILALPVFITVGLILFKRIKVLRLNWVQIPLAAAVVCVCVGITVLILNITDHSRVSAMAMIKNNNSSTEASVKKLGLIATTVQEAVNFGNEETGESMFLETALDVIENESSERNETEIDFVKLSETEGENAKISEYLSGISATSKNEYTGIAEGYNVITICAEAFHPLLIDKDLTPTLYELSNSGIVFENFYNSFRNTTTNGEYTFCMGLLPDMSRTKVESCFDEAADNYLPFCLGNILDNYGYNTYAYHNYYATFYDRHITHPNMGYEFKAVSSGLEIEANSPASDWEMMEQSMKDYINDNRLFHAYYMTYSGHYQYNWENDMSMKHKEEVDNLPYSDTVKAYIACNLEVEYALQTLMEALEKAGKADNTMIVLSADHYPYGLPEENFNELAGEEVDTSFEIYRNSFICYIPGIETVRVDDYCSSKDILPTILNLLGVEYDSRLLAGKDVLSDAPKIAVLSDHSFITEEFRYNAATGEVIKKNSSVNVDEIVLQEYCNYVDNMFTLSAAIANNDYYGYVYEVEQQVQDDLVNYVDVKEPYLEAAISYMVENEFMEPVSDTFFGSTREQRYVDFLQVMYEMEGSPEVYEGSEYEPALTWALQEGLLYDVKLWRENMTLGQMCEMIYERFYDPYTDEWINVYEYTALYPEIPQESIRAIVWCMNQKIINGTGEIKSTIELHESSVRKAEMAMYLQRLYIQ